MDLQSIKCSWQRIEEWLRDRERGRELAAPATRRDISWAEECLGTVLPEEHVELLKCHNGGGSFTLPPYFEILSTSELVDAWRTKTRVWSEDPYHPYMNHWVPFASDRAGGILYLDSKKPQDRHVYGHDREGNPHLSTHPMWKSLTSLMHHTAQALHSGHRLDRFQRPGEEEDSLLWEVFLDD